MNYTNILELLALIRKLLQIIRNSCVFVYMPVDGYVKNSCLLVHDDPKYTHSISWCLVIRNLESASYEYFSWLYLNFP